MTAVIAIGTKVIGTYTNGRHSAGILVDRIPDGCPDGNHFIIENRQIRSRVASIVTVEDFLKAHPERDNK